MSEVADASTTFSHLGVCVSDLDRAKRFYRNALGFEERLQLTGSDKSAARLVRVDRATFTSTFLRRGQVLIELLHFDQPGHTGSGVAKEMNELGLTHLSFRVSALEDVLGLVERYDGTVFHDSRINLDTRWQRQRGGCPLRRSRWHAHRARRSD